ncbi:MAG: ABC transporter permease [Gemmatimonadetes bacterium]|nr:ABC transporter permease [Gemmatimonadota bacterium]
MFPCRHHSEGADRHLGCGGGRGGRRERGAASRGRHRSLGGLDGSLSGRDIGAPYRRRARRYAGLGRLGERDTLFGGKWDLPVPSCAVPAELGGGLHRRYPGCGEFDDGDRILKILRVLLRIEWLKAVRRRAFWVAVAAFTAFTSLPVIERVRGAHSNPNAVFALPESWPVVLGTAGIGPLFIAALMILLVAQEFSWRTARQNVIDGLSKERFYAGKVMLLAGLVLLFTSAPVLIGVGGTMLSPGEGGPGFIRASDFGYISGLVLGMLLFGSAGLMLSVHLRSSGASLGILFLYLFVEEGVAMLMLGTGRESLRNVAEFLPFNVVEDLGDDLVHYPDVLAEVNAERAEAGLAPLEFLDVEMLAVAALAYTAFFLGLSLLNMRRRDL